MSTDKVKLSWDGDVAIITLNDPATMNAAGVDVAKGLTEAIDAVTSGDKVARAVVLTGEGRGFCSGANLSFPGRGEGGGDGTPPDAGSALETVYNPMVHKLSTMDVPLVTAVNGAAAGVGCSLALMGDLIVAAESAYFLQAFRRIGLIPDGGSTWLLPRMIGRARAMEMTLLGERIHAAQALEWGMINRCVPDAELMSTALELAHKLATGPASIGMIRKAMWAALDNNFVGQLDYERHAQAKAGRTSDFAEGVAAFLQKRPAEFKGK